MAEDRDDMETAALDWVIRLRDPGFDGWEEFEAWLSADAAHADAYHRLAIADEDMADLLKTAPPQKQQTNPLIAMPERRPLTRRAWMGGAIAASLAAIVGIGLIDRQPALYPIETAPGMRRTITLDDGSKIALNGGTKIKLSRRDPRYAVLESGEALFDVVHDASAPFKVAVGDARLIDVGTRFNVLREGKATAVQVAEGAVIYNPDGEAVRLNPGQTLSARDGDAKLVLGSVAPAAVAGWKDGRLIYDGQTMAEVAADLARWSGQPVRADPRVAGQRFRGVLSLADGDDIVHLAPLLDVDVRRNGQIWVLSPKSQ
ncbi:iron dicitrate transport regulator FecR [Sphingomonas sp. Root710]|uniref:FecR family protein n=1 Tax=Sphingomonas sp. Root710 TaxID=1736594 RepID=UPI0006F87FD1|nr:FecR domain-containing protein [Sphingomonas sp. Root710]KRB82277.1 iron dicitrate transport regulator FecR [Sphingomonas sp. Root710]